ncbi:MAG: hypothetical protein JO352_09075 [Chloroflexi bacterium]|nr:hypothetical protein [Chloroflexota bacterium]
MDPSSQALAQRTSATLQITASAGTGLLSSWSVEITYDPAVVQVNGCNLGAPGVCSPRFGPHTIRVDGGTIQSRRGPTTLARVTFTAVAARGTTTPIGIKVLIFADAGGTTSKPTIVPGQLQIE